MIREYNYFIENYKFNSIEFHESFVNDLKKFIPHIKKELKNINMFIDVQYTKLDIHINLTFTHTFYDLSFMSKRFRIFKDIKYINSITEKNSFYETLQNIYINIAASVFSLAHNMPSGKVINL